MLELNIADGTRFKEMFKIIKTRELSSNKSMEAPRKNVFSKSRLTNNLFKYE